MQLPLRFSSSQTVRNLQGLGVLWSYLHMSTIWGVNVSRCSSTRGQAGTICHNKTTWWISSCSFCCILFNPFWLKFIGENNSNIDVSLRWFPSSYVLFNHWWAAKVRKSHRVCTKSGQPATPSLGLEMMFEQDRQIDSTWHIYAVSMRCIYIYIICIFIYLCLLISHEAATLTPSAHPWPANESGDVWHAWFLSRAPQALRLLWTLPLLLSVLSRSALEPRSHGHGSGSSDSDLWRTKTWETSLVDTFTTYVVSCDYQVNWG